jgi:hypothetical protein
MNSLYAIYLKSQLTTLIYASGQAFTSLILLMMWLHAARGHRHIATSMERSHLISISLQAFLTQMIFLLSIAIMVLRNDSVLSLVVRDGR